MSEEIKSSDKLLVHHNPSAPAAKRITEEQFTDSASDWLAIAKRGEQVIVFDTVTEATSDSAPASMVLGMNGVLFQLPEDPPPELPKPKAEAENKWLK